MKRRDIDLAVALILLIGSVVVVAASAPPAVRVPVALAFLGLAPGVGWVRVLGLGSPLQELGAIVAVSISSDIIISQAVTSIASFQTRPVTVAIGVWTVLGLLVCFAVRERSDAASSSATPINATAVKV